jgi:hypothetical protein
MTLFSPTVLYRRIAMRNQRISPDTFGVWASVILIGLAIVSVILGVAPVVDPTPAILSPTEAALPCSEPDKTTQPRPVRVRSASGTRIAGYQRSEIQR